MSKVEIFRGRGLASGPKWLSRLALLALALASVVIASVGGVRESQAQEPFIGEIRLVPYNFAPSGWAFCDGQLMPIDENTALFSLIGTTYGGDGQTTFALPNLEGRVPVGMGAGPGLSNYVLGETFGVERVTLAVGQLPSHTHSVAAGGSIGTTDRPNGALLAQDGAGVAHYGPNAKVHLSPLAIGNAGGGQSHENRPPFLAEHYIISLFGIYPSQNAPQDATGASQHKAAPGTAEKVSSSAEGNATGAAK